MNQDFDFCQWEVAFYYDEEITERVLCTIHEYICSVFIITISGSFHGTSSGDAL